VHVCASVRVFAGNFQVVLIVDNQETTTKSMFRGVLLKELSRYGEHTPPIAPGGRQHTPPCSGTASDCLIHAGSP